MVKYGSRHTDTFDQAIEIMRAVQLLGGGANLYDNTTASVSHWLIEIYSLPTTDWTEQQFDEAAQ